MRTHGVADTQPKYYATHLWVNKYFGKASYCENDRSHESYRFEWASISGEYKRERKDWRQLCQRCHAKLDKYKPYCRNGHEYTEDNIYVAPKDGKRHCRKCRTEAATRGRRRRGVPCRILKHSSKQPS